MVERKGAYRDLVGKLEGRRPLGRRRQTLDGKIILKCIKYLYGVGVGWIDLAEDRDEWRTLVKAVRNIRASSKAGNLTS
jgi:hypothetical protein